MAEKVSTLVLKVDIECPCCYKKFKKILCKFHEIRDQIFDEKNKTVIIIGPFCPNKMAKKLCCKAGKMIISIDEKTKDPEKKTNNPPKVECKPDAQVPKPVTKDPEPASKEPVLAYPVPAYPVPVYPVPVYPIGICCRPCYERYGGGPCYHGCRMPPRPPPCDGGCGCGRPPCDGGCGRQPVPCDDGCGRPPCDGRCERPPPCDDGCGRPPPCCDDCERKGNVTRCDYYGEENLSCMIM